MLHNRERCHRCGADMVVGFSVPNDVWHEVMSGRDHPVCINCFDFEARFRNLEWLATLTDLWLVSWGDAAHFVPEGTRTP